MRWSWRREEAEALLPELRAVRAQLTVTLAELQAFDARLRAVARQLHTHPGPTTQREVPGD